MEYRRSVRRRLVQAVTLASPRVGAVSANMRDVSLGGMFVETNPIDLPHNAPITVSFRLPRGEHFHINAMVVRRAPTGAGLMFLRMETGVIRSLSDALSRYGAPGPKE